MNDFLAQATEFRKCMDQTVKVFHPETLNTQRALISEEYNEFLDAHCEAITYTNNLRSRAALLKELTDLVYVCFQYASAAGWDLNEALDRVHRSNLSKLGDDMKPIKREDGKVLKGPNYKQPVLIDLVSK